MRLLPRPLTGVSLALCLASPVLTTAHTTDPKQADPKAAAKAEGDALEFKACGPRDKEAKFAANTDKQSHPTPQLPADAAIVYVLRPTMIGQKIQTTLAVDADWKGVNRGNNYFFFTLPPGEHAFCSKAENRSVMSLTVEAGKTYYLQQHIEMGFVKARTSLDQMTEAEALKKLPGLHLSTWTIKK